MRTRNDNNNQRPAWDLRFSRWRVTAIGPLSNAVMYVVDAVDDGSAADVVFLVSRENTIVGVERIGVAAPITRREAQAARAVYAAAMDETERYNLPENPPEWHVFLGAARYAADKLARSPEWN